MPLPLLTDLTGGTIYAGSIAYGAPVGTAKILAVTAPGVPTMRESNFANATGATWIGLYGPAGLRPEIVTRLNQSTDDFAKDHARNDDMGERIGNHAQSDDGRHRGDDRNRRERARRSA